MEYTHRKLDMMRSRSMIKKLAFEGLNFGIFDFIYNKFFVLYNRSDCDLNRALKKFMPVELIGYHIHH